MRCNTFKGGWWPYCTPLCGRRILYSIYAETLVPIARPPTDLAGDRRFTHVRAKLEHGETKRGYCNAVKRCHVKKSRDRPDLQLTPRELQLIPLHYSLSPSLLKAQSTERTKSSWKTHGIAAGASRPRLLMEVGFGVGAFVIPRLGYKAP